MSDTLEARIAYMNQRMADPRNQTLPDLFIGRNNGQDPLDSKGRDLRFRGKKISELTREEAIDALHHAVARIVALEWIIR